MEALDITKLSSKGQVVIPTDIRESLNLETGTKFLIFGEGDTVILKKVGRPALNEIKTLFSNSRKIARKVGLKKTDVSNLIKKVRNK
jgi:antitoxin PrlF